MSSNAIITTVLTFQALPELLLVKLRHDSSKFVQVQDFAAVARPVFVRSSLQPSGGPLRLTGSAGPDALPGSGHF